MHLLSGNLILILIYGKHRHMYLHSSLYHKNRFLAKFSFRDFVDLISSSCTLDKKILFARNRRTHVNEQLFVQHVLCMS